MNVRATATLVAVGLFLVYNANGREIGSVDTQPTKFAARELALRGSLRLGHVVGERPGLAERAAFIQDRSGNWRSAYPILPSILAAPVAGLLSAARVIDLEAPLAPTAIAVVSASLLTVSAVVLAFLALARIVPRGAALLTVAGIALGTNYWPFVGRTLSGQEKVVLGCALALWAGLRPDRGPTAREALIGAAGLALAGAARPQVAPLVAMMAWWLVQRDRRHWLVVAAPIAAAAAISIALNWYWFGTPLGGTAQLESQHWFTHRVHGSLSTTPWIGLAGLLFSPSRGLLVFSPVVLVALFGIRRGLALPGLGLRWVLGAALAQLAGYACYTVWWGGHSFGPRYAIDILMPLTPFAALGCTAILAGSWVWRVPAALMLLWSIGVAALGAFVYPNDLWNSEPVEVDVNHERLWDVADTQILRAWRSSPSPQNFDLFTRAGLRRTE